MTGDLPVNDQTEQGIRLIEDERRRIARDLHDGPAQALTNVSMRLDILKQVMQTNPTVALTEVDKINTRLVATINDIRRLIYDLRPLAIEEIGFLSAIRDLCSRCEEEWNVLIQIRVAEGFSDREMKPTKQVALYRLVQEVINNIHKHAKASLITVDIDRKEEAVEVAIEDNGKGFDPSVIPPGHFGLIGMQERAAYLGGYLHISSEIDHGSKFVIVIPVSEL